jgi:hypothetical protein
MKLTRRSLEARIAPQEREYLEASDRNGLNRNQVSRTTLRGSLSSRKPTNFVCRR